jgi:hypothetical protein
MLLLNYMQHQLLFIVVEFIDFNEAVFATIYLIALVDFYSQNYKNWVTLSNPICGAVLMFSYATSRDSFSVYSSYLRNNNGQAFDMANHGRFRGL